MKMPQSEDNTKPKRAQLKHLLIDVHFFNLPKIRALGKHFGISGKLSLVEAYCQMSCSTNAIISRDALECIAEDNEIETSKIDEFIKYCLAHKLIIEESKGYSNSRVIKDQESYGNKLEKDRKRKDSSGIRAESLRIPPDPDIDYDYDHIDLKKNGVPEQPPKFLEIAEASLVPKTDPRLPNLNEFITMGKRPMTKYPSIRLTAYELADILEQYEQVGIPIDERRIFEPAFKNVASRLKSKASGGAPPINANAYNWLIGFAKTDLLREYKATLDLKRSETYLEKARV